jgi:hypothetical protein
MTIGYSAWLDRANFFDGRSTYDFSGATRLCNYYKTQIGGIPRLISVSLRNRVRNRGQEQSSADLFIANGRATDER